MATKKVAQRSGLTKTKSEGPKGLRGGRIIEYRGQKGKVVNLLSNVKANIKITETGEEMTVLRKELSFPRKTPSKKSTISKKKQEKSIPEEKEKSDITSRYFSDQPSFTIIRPRYLILGTTSVSGLPSLKELQSTIASINKELGRGDKVKLAFVNFNADRYQEAEDEINDAVDKNNEHQALKTAIKELQVPPSSRGIEISQLRWELIVLDLKRVYSVPYLQILDNFSKKLGLNSNPTSLISFCIPENEDEDPHATQFVHNVLLISYNE